jgi:glycosyltransferase involved in cell wall biosynthesis
MSRPLVSIMIPTYGQARLVGRAIESALAQTYEPLEVVVGDDASPDETRSVVERFDDRRLRYHRNPRNFGRAGNYRQLLFQVARGDWAVNLDGDDCFTDPDFVDIAMRSAETAGSNVVLVVGQVATVVNGERVSSRRQAPGVLSGHDFVLRASDLACHPMHLGCIYRRDLALGLDFYRSEALSSDLESLYRLACHGDVALLDREVGEWHVTRGSATEAISATETLNNLRIWRSIEDELMRTGAPARAARKAMRSARRKIAMAEAVRLARANRSDEAIRVVRELPHAGIADRIRLAASPRLWAHVVLGALRFPRRSEKLS